tara:strand:- start:5357 stop:5596 length:240 start_codon:yes stop_codon:yes gene_type:complete
MNYEKEVMELAYGILIKEDFKWRHEFKPNMKLEIVQLVLDYFTDIEHYEKCSKLNEMVKRLETYNENIGETTSSGSEDP